MAYRVWGQRWTTIELTDASMYQKVSCSENTLLRAVRTKFIVYNNPTVTALSMKIYSNNASAPKKLLRTSTNTITKATLVTLDNGVKEAYFTFEDAPLRAGDFYHFVINATGYTATDSSHLAWLKGYPDPVNTTGLTVTNIKIGVLPYFMAFIGDTF